MTDLNKLIDEVLELDAKASNGPWEVDNSDPNEQLCIKSGDTYLMQFSLSQKDCELVAHYRTATPILARELRELQGHFKISRESDLRSLTELRKLKPKISEFEAENARLREALEAIKNRRYNDSVDSCRQIARAALEDVSKKPDNFNTSAEPVKESDTLEGK